VADQAYASMTDSSTAARSVKEIPSVLMKKTGSSVLTVEGLRCAPMGKGKGIAKHVMDPRSALIKSELITAKSVVDPRYALTGKGNMTAKNVHASMKKLGGSARSAVPRRPL